MTTKLTIIITLVLIAASLCAGWLLWDRLPEQVASHWNINDEVDGYMPKVWGVLLLPLISAGMLTLFLFLPAMDPLRTNVAQFREAFNLFIVFITIFMLYIHGLTLAWSLGYLFKMSSALLPMMGLLFIIVGWMLKQAKRNFFIGIRTPWTLSSDSVWDKTHRVGAVLFMASGALTIIGGFFGGITAFWMMFAPLIGSTIFLLFYSYFLYRQETKDNSRA
jgi:uncharacterized membrane protein